MLWTCDWNKKEFEFIKTEYILKPNKEKEIESKKKGNIEEKVMYIKSASVHYGIELKIVLNYKDSINEIIKQSTHGLCDYYVNWAICGPPYEILTPQEKGNENKNNLI